MSSNYETYIQTVREYVDRMLQLAADHDGGTPLFVDGVNVDSNEPVRWQCRGEEWTVSNLGNQQNWLRTLQGLSQLTGETEYKQAAADAFRYALDHLQYGGLLWWGGHMAYDLAGKKGVYAPDKGKQHEFKCHYPYYELMREIAPEETERFIETFWDYHILNWSNLEFSRHGNPEQASGRDDVWDYDYTGDPVFFTGKGLTFINAGSDLIYAAGMLYHFTGNDAPLKWAKRLAERYVETRNPATGLGGYQFSISVLPGVRGDRAIDQFGEQLKAHAPIEATLNVSRQVLTIIGEAAIIKMLLAEKLGAAGREIAEWTVQDLLAYGKYAYDAQDNTFHPMLTDGTRLTGLVMDKTGYYGKQGEALGPAKGDFVRMRSYAIGYRLSKEPLLWEVARGIAAGNGLGDIGSVGGETPAMNQDTACSDPRAVFALLELYDATRQSEFLSMACAVGNNIVKHRYIKGFFVPSERHVFAKLDAVEPLALLHLAGALRGERDQLPVYCSGNSFFGSEYDGLGHQTDNQLFYARTV